VEQLLDLAAGLPTRALAPGEHLITDGTDEDVLYVLLDGALRVEKAGVSITTIADVGACIGEMSLLLGRPATTDVVAIEPSVVAVASDARRRVNEDPTLTLLLARMLASRLHVMTTYLADLKQQYAEHEGGLGMVDTVLGSLMRTSSTRRTLSSARDPHPEY
jgi:CRP/FNR family cyclic AMP-dependent transcriptional regulator